MGNYGVQVLLCYWPVLLLHFFFSIRVFFYGHWRFTICPNSPVLNGGLPLSEGSARPPVYYWNLPFWDDPDLNVRYLWIFQVDHIFYKLDVKILVTSNEFKCVRALLLPTIFIMSSRSASIELLIVLALAKEPQGTSLGINTL